MYEISCEMCMDLMPLVNDGVASEDSRKAVERHIQTCDACRAMFEGNEAPPADEEKVLSKAMKKVQTISMVIGLLLLFLGICLAETVMQGSSMLLVLVALMIRGLFRIAFRRGEGRGQIVKRIAAFLTAAALTWGVVWLGNEIFGNPISKMQAKKEIQSYMAENFPGMELDIEEVSYVSSSSTYEAEISVVDARFQIVYRDGKILYDTYGEELE